LKGEIGVLNGAISDLKGEIRILKREYS